MKKKRFLTEIPALQVRVPFVPPYDWDWMLEFLGTRAIPGVESVDARCYRRSIEVGRVHTGVEVRRGRKGSCLELRILAPYPTDLPRTIGRFRRMFDVDSDPVRIARHFGGDSRLSRLVRMRPGLRLPGAWDPFELAIRAILGQQVSVRAASTLAGRLAGRFGRAVSVGLPGLTHLFPPPSRLVEADLDGMGIPAARARAIRATAKAVLDGSLVLDGGRSSEETIGALRALPGIGDWTAQYIAMRALGEPDAFPAGDLGVRHAISRNGHRLGSAAIRRVAEPWRPYRAYAVLHLWRSLSSAGRR